MSTDEALQLLATLCADSVASALRELGSEVAVGAPEVVPQGSSPFADAPAPGIGVNVDLDDGLAGESILLLAEGAAARLAEAAPPEDEDSTGAVRRVAVHVTSAVAAAVGGVLGQGVSVGDPTTLRFATVEEAGGSSEKSPHAFVVPFTVDGESGRFVQCLQNAFLIKVAPGLEGLPELSDAAGEAGDGVPEDALHDVKVRVWAELGRARLPLAQAVSIPSGAVVQLDRAAEDHVELFVNGRLFAHGRLVIREQEWAVEIEELVSGPRPEVAVLVDTPAAQPAEIATDNSPR